MFKTVGPNKASVCFVTFDRSRPLTVFRPVSTRRRCSVVCAGGIIFEIFRIRKQRFTGLYRNFSENFPFRRYGKVSEWIFFDDE